MSYDQVPELDSSKLEYKSEVDPYGDAPAVGTHLLGAGLAVCAFYGVYIFVTGAQDVSAKAPEPSVVSAEELIHQEEQAILEQLASTEVSSSERSVPDEDEAIYEKLKVRLGEIGKRFPEEEIATIPEAAELVSEVEATPKKAKKKSYKGGTIRAFFLNTILPDYYDYEEEKKEKKVSKKKTRAKNKRVASRNEKSEKRSISRKKKTRVAKKRSTSSRSKKTVEPEEFEGPKVIKF